MRLYRFSPITQAVDLQETLLYIHTTCHQLCQSVLGSYLPASGSIGVFCHYADEYNFLISLRKKITDESVHYKEKYYLLKEPLVYAADSDTPEARYYMLYVRQPDPYRAQVGYIDFVLHPLEFSKLIAKVQANEHVAGMRIVSGGNRDMIELYHPDFDVLAYIVDRPILDELQVDDAHIGD